MEAFKAADVMPNMVQIGNEIASGLLWNGTFPSTVNESTVGGANTGYPWTGGTNNTGFDRLATLLSAGTKGARDGADPGDEPLVMIHHDQGSNWNATSYYFSRLLPRMQANGADPDVLGYSYYPLYHAGGIAGVAQNLNNSANTYGKPVAIVETGFPFRNPQSDEQSLGFPVTQAGQQQFLDALVDTVQAVPNDRGLGVFWWYAEARPTTGLNVFEGGRYGLFDQNGNVLPAASVFEQFLPTPGDFNKDGYVDAADYTVWRNDPLREESGYRDWKANFGTMPSGSGSLGPLPSTHNIPEPTSLALVTAIIVCSACRRSRAACRIRSASCTAARTA
jgi:arabinogalactan endo-1,4-beta-galactosidase